MKTYLSRYQLIRKSDQSVQHGALIKLLDEDGHWGVSDICPWPHLGDLKLDLEISSKGPLYQRAKYLAHLDLRARKEQLQLISDKPVQVNELVTNYKNKPDPFAVIKIKGDQQIESLLEFIKKLQNKHIRLDFNSALSLQQFAKVIPFLPSTVTYVEDPTEWNEELWKQWNQAIPLAVDFALADPFSFPTAWSYLIIKPSRQDADHLIQKCLALDKKFTLTSAMDHPVGFAHGLRYAQNYTKMISGFSTLDLYEESEFNAYFQTNDNSVKMKKSSDFGIGMTTALNNLAWVGT